MMESLGSSTKRYANYSRQSDHAGNMEIRSRRNHLQKGFSGAHDS